jgi:hypothetical protein
MAAVSDATTFHYISLHFTTFHYISLHFTTFHGCCATTACYKSVLLWMLHPGRLSTLLQMFQLGMRSTGLQNTHIDTEAGSI